MTKNAEPVRMDHRVDLYIPSQCICGNSLPEAIRKKVIEEVKSRFDTWFGSHAEITIKGDWRLPDGNIAKEEVSDLYSFCTGEALEEHQEDVDRNEWPCGKWVDGTRDLLIEAPAILAATYRGWWWRSQ